MINILIISNENYNNHKRYLKLFVLMFYSLMGDINFSDYNESCYIQSDYNESGIIDYLK